MSSSASLKEREESKEVAWIVVATAVAVLLTGLLVKNEGPRPTSDVKSALEFAAREYYDG